EGRASGLDRLFLAAFTLSFFVLCAAPTRLFYMPVEYSGAYQTFIPPNLIDLMWLGILIALFLRTRPASLSSRAWLGVAILMLCGLLAIIAAGDDSELKLADLASYNFRIFAALAIGSLMARKNVSAIMFGTLLVAGASIIALSTFVLVGGGASYD